MSSSDPMTVERVARIINERHLTPAQAERANAEGWELDRGERVTLSADDLHEAYARSMLMHAGLEPRDLASPPAHRDADEGPPKPDQRGGPHGTPRRGS